MAFKNPARNLTWPPGAGSGDTRIVAGADTPPELSASFDIDVALLFYVQDFVTGVEIGYFFIAISNNSNDVPSNPTLLNGQVIYPVPGNPQSATAGDVKINYRSVMHPSTTPLDMVYNLHVISAFGGHLSFQTGSGISSILTDQTSDVPLLRFSQASGIGTVEVVLPSEFVIHGRNQGRGFVMADIQTADSAAVGAEAIVHTLTDAPLLNGRCYELRAECDLNPSVANVATVRIRKNNIAGAVRGNAFFPTTGAGVFAHQKAHILIKNTSGSDILTDEIVMTLQASAGTVTQTAATNRLRRLELWDYGAASDFPSVIQW